ncbi:MAG: hypothetical protein IIA67_10670 [Planctomycetes bacterium]|nr:hypothetical protein [Planctomycetota bacterium]
MKSQEDRKQELLEQLRDPQTRDEVVAHLKSLMDLSPKDKLPHGTAIIEDILIKEYGESLLQQQLRRANRTTIRRVYLKPQTAETAEAK